LLKKKETEKYMPLTIGVPRETEPGERRVAVIPEVVKKFKSLGVAFCIECGAGAGSYFQDSDFETANLAENSQEVFARSGIIFKVQPPTLDEIRLMRPNTVLLGFFNPYQDKERARLLCSQNITTFAVELIPRISRAQSMDALSSQASVAGYQCALIAAVRAPKFFPMITYAAGSLRPARALVIGVGVAGLQAIATAHRLGAMVSAYDVRPETREQVESLGAKFIDTGVAAGGAGGYARELTDDEKKHQQEKLSQAVSQADVLITTAAIPGRKSPLIVTDDMVRGMRPGSIVVDMAAETGGNVAGSRPGETVIVQGVSIVGTTNLASSMPVHASEMYSKNLFNFISPFIKNGELEIDWTDEIIAGSLFTHEGQIRHEGVKKALQE
jgi:NAD(P) transhydrogenase subunit alpha